MRPARVRGAGCWRSWCWALLLAATAAGGRAAAPRCPPAHTDRCQFVGQSFREFKFIVDGEELQLRLPDYEENRKCLTLTYPKVATLDEPVLPRFDELRKEACVVLVSAKNLNPLPVANETTYAGVLRALNVSVFETLMLQYGSLRSEHLANLTMLPELKLKYMDFKTSARDLHHLTGLRRLTLENTELSTADLQLLPTGLEQLHLTRTGIGRVPPAAFARLSKLTALLVTEEHGPVLVEAAGGLRTLTIRMSEKNATVGLALPAGLENLTITGWEPRLPKPWKACAGLGALELVDAAIEVLPKDWVANCTALHTLIVNRAASLTSLQPGALSGAIALSRLSLKECALNALPADLLEHIPNLNKLDLSYNQLVTLPSTLFFCANNLRELVLSWNKLNSSALAALTEGKLHSLNVLRLNHNEALDACPAPKQQWSNLESLRILDLSYTKTSQICEDWRQLPKLQKLFLKNTAIARLERVDLRFNTVGDVTVDLTGANMTALVFERNDWESLKGEGGVGVRVVLSKPLLCDCQLYWAAAALHGDAEQRRAAWLRVEGAHCTGRRPLDEVPLDELVCKASVQCPTGCACGEREDSKEPGRVLRLACRGAELSRVPAEDFMRNATGLDLQLSDNVIDALRPEDLPKSLKTLDLRNNSLTLIDAATAEALISRPDRRVWLAGNPLDCSCRAAAALAALHLSSKVFADRAVATCVDGRPLVAAALDSRRQCGVTEGDSYLVVVVVTALVIVVMVMAALALALLRPELRLRVKAAMRAWGLLPRAREADDGRVYDAFVSFAHADEAVVRELVERLESGARPLRLCVHYRDWAPGGWIPTQIAASVRVSRRTVAVVSAAFLRSRWARAEFREAYAAALRDAEPRLVVVLLEDPALLPLDAELRAYLAANTYVRWGDPWFWPKLRRALPASRRTDASPTGVKSTDASALAATTVSTDASVLSATTVSTDESTRSLATVSIS